jgi:hypothetical protein
VCAKLTCFPRAKCFCAQGVNTEHESMVIISHRVSWKKSGIAQRSKLLFLITCFDHVGIHQIPMIHSFAERVLVVSQNFLSAITATFIIINIYYASAFTRISHTHYYRICLFSLVFYALKYLALKYLALMNDALTTVFPTAYV